MNKHIEEISNGKKILSVSFICLFLLFACSQEVPAIKVDLSKREQVNLKEQPDVLTFAYLPDVLSEQERGRVAIFY